MGAETHIQWTDATVNFWMGCKKVSPGCKFCYMYRDMAHYGRDPHAIVRCKDATFYQAMKWKKARKIFTCSWSDFFVEQADGWRADAWKVIRDTPQHIWQILTKRPERIKDHLPTDWGDGYPNVWLGASVESQEYAEKRIPELIGIPAIVRFLSCEPLLGPLDLENVRDREYLLNVLAGSYGQHSYKIDFSFGMAGLGKINWVITGGESGSKARPAELDWFRSLRDQCQKNRVAFFHKQNGGFRKINDAWGGRELDGRTWDEMPAILEAATR